MHIVIFVKIEGTRLSVYPDIGHTTYAFKSQNTVIILIIILQVTKINWDRTRVINLVGTKHYSHVYFYQLTSSVSNAYYRFFSIAAIKCCGFGLKEASKVISEPNSFDWNKYIVYHSFVSLIILGIYKNIYFFRKV